MMLWLQEHFSQEGFWIFVGVRSVVVIGAAIIFRRPE